jgi:glutamine amidotransferase
LGWIDAETIRFDKTKFSQDLAIPHMGWSDVQFNPKFSLASEYSEPNPRFYFVHSYYIQAAEKEHVLATANYGIEFTAAVCREKIVGAQFHPEKSHKFGMEFLRCFAKLHVNHTHVVESR